MVPVQHYSLFFTLLPPEIRNQIYECYTIDYIKHAALRVHPMKLVPAWPDRHAFGPSTLSHQLALFSRELTARRPPPETVDVIVIHQRLTVFVVELLASCKKVCPSAESVEFNGCFPRLVVERVKSLVVVKDDIILGLGKVKREEGADFFESFVVKNF
ncbi:uncharacterized protein B0I36DRAFT_363554 [Microdochium trichocladiopsis]|uniref:Uncharacterized protein n=1 Tax=Microdochium trichocladiopsis TaxID=1682393 RepID=A0A9P9BP71_9PEZI|nr:uncharacterized protein B0I36DRAFT_363554 [Microdochium trichocladiopsis]KAH7028947.1 hypothetical protein B0I36DRAFT_363554 [Microdochium trichocladiopsis]